MSVLVITTQEDLDKLVETKVRAALANRPTPSPQPRRQRGAEKWWMPRFLSLLAETGNAREAIDQLQGEGGPSRSTVYRARDLCPKFRKDWDRAVAGRIGGDR